MYGRSWVQIPSGLRCFSLSHTRDKLNTVTYYSITELNIYHLCINITIWFIVLIEEKSSESLKSNTSTKQGDADSAARKTLSASSPPAMGTQRRSRIKPAVTSVARSRPNTANKGKPAEARCSSGVTSSKEDNLSVSQGHSCNKDDPLSKRLVLDEQNGQGAVDSVSTGKFGMKYIFYW